VEEGVSRQCLRGRQGAVSTDSTPWNKSASTLVQRPEVKSGSKCFLEAMTDCPVAGINPGSGKFGEESEVLVHSLGHSILKVFSPRQPDLGEMASDYALSNLDSSLFHSLCAFIAQTE
jgi:hypothetical protein